MTVRPGIVMLALLAMAWWRPLAAAPEGYACAYRAGAAPCLDGRIEDDPFWSGVARSADFRLIGREGAASPLATWFKIAYTDAALHIGIWCEEPRMDTLKADAAPGGELWTDDSVEVFLAAPSIQPYLHLVVNTKGVRFNGRGLERVDPMPWTAACFKGAASYSIEISMPYTTLLAAPERGACWTGNLGRNLRTIDKCASWAPVATGFHNAAIFLPLSFSAGAVCPEAEARLRRHLLDGLRDRQRRMRAWSGPGERDRFDARLVDAANGLIERQGAAASPRMLATLLTEQERTLDRAAALVAQWREARALQRVAGLFACPAEGAIGDEAQER